MREEIVRQLDRLDEEVHNRLTHYRFNRRIEGDERYRKGRIAALSWLAALCAHYRRKAKAIPTEMEESLERELTRIRRLEPSSYRQGIEDAVGEFRRLLRGE